MDTSTISAAFGMGYYPPAPVQPPQQGNNTFEVPASDDDTLTTDNTPVDAQTQPCEPQQTNTEPAANDNVQPASDNKTPETKPQESANNDPPTSENNNSETQTASENNNSETQAASANTEQPNTQQAESEPQNNTNQGPAAPQPAIVQNWLAQYSTTVEQGEEGLVRKFNITKPGRTLSELLAAAKTQNNTQQTQNNTQQTQNNTQQTQNNTQQTQNNTQQAQNDTQKTQNTTQQTQNNTVTAANQQDESASNATEPNNDNTAATTQAEAAQQTGKTVTPQNTPAESNVAITGQQSPNANQQNQNAIEKPDGLSGEQTDNKLAQPQQAQTPSDTLESGKPQVEQLPEAVISQKAALTASENLASQNKNQNNSKTTNGSNTAFEQMLSPNNAQASAFEPSSASAQVGGTTQNVSTVNTPTDLSQQIQESVQTSLNQGSRQITVQLNPPELGNVSITFQENEDSSGQLTALLEVSKAETRAQIQAALPEVVRNLADSGIQIKRFEVVLTDQPEQQALKEQSSPLTQDSWNSQQGSTGSDTTENTSSNQWMTENFINSQTEFNEQQMLVTDKSINVLA